MKHLRYTLAAVILLIAIPFIIWSSGIVAARLSPPEAGIPDTASCTPAVLQPGDIATVTMQVTLPADEKISAVKITGSDIIQQATNAEVIKWQWNRRIWQITGKFQVLKPGKVDDLHLDIVTGKIYSNRSGKNFSAAVPELLSQLDGAENAETELLLAGEIHAPKQPESFLIRHRYLLAGTAVFLLIAAIAFYLIRKRRTADLPPWEIARNDIAVLRDDVNYGLISAEQATVKLSDLLRNYLENRFRLPASHLTTAEFLTGSLNKESFLKEEQKNFLRNFLTTSDLIKFARQKSTPAGFEQAAVQADEFIHHTIPEEKK